MKIEGIPESPGVNAVPLPASPDRPSYSDLIYRLEAASGGDGELDRLLAHAMGWFRVQPRFTVNRKGGWIAPEDFMGVDAEGRPRLDSLHGTTIHRDPPRFTTSLDAIVALIERKFPVQLPAFVALASHTTTTASKFALGLCIALLRALEPGHGG